MEEIYRVCAKARDDYIKSAEANLPSYCFRYDEGERYIVAEEYDRIRREGRYVYEKKLNELSKRVALTAKFINPS